MVWTLGDRGEPTAMTGIHYLLRLSLFAAQFKPSVFGALVDWNEFKLINSKTSSTPVIPIPIHD